MNFISFNFWLIFMPVGLIAYYALSRHVKLQNLVLLLLSMAFYMSFSVKKSLFIFTSIAITYVTGLVIDRHPGWRHPAVIIGSVLNIGVLVGTKCTNLFIRGFNSVFGALGVGLPPVGWAATIGISFFVLQSSTYLFSLYNDKISVKKNPIDFALFVMFFPTVVSGPIQRAEELFPQIENRRSMTFEKLKKAVTLFMMGAFMKLVIADRLSQYTDVIFDGFDSNYTYGMYMLAAVICYSIQLYADFAGYSNMAIAVAMLFGFDLKDNFNSPYMATSIADFWRRWHISLSSWLRDYVYIPLGGNRKGAVRKYINVLIVFAVSGLWHGAAIGYIAWGMLHGLYQIISGVTKNLRCKITDALKINRQNAAYKWFQRLIVFVLVSFTWIFFREASLSGGILYIRRMCSRWNPEILVNGGITTYLSKIDWYLAAFGTLAMAVVGIIGKWKVIEHVIKWKYVFWAALIIAVFLFTAVFGVYGPGYSASKFIYAGF